MKRSVFFLQDVIVSETTDDAGYELVAAADPKTVPGSGNEPEITAETGGYSPQSIYEKYWAALIGSNIERMERVMVK